MKGYLAWCEVPFPKSHDLALIGGLCAWYLHGFVDYFYEFTPDNTVFWLLVGLIISVAVPFKNPFETD